MINFQFWKAAIISVLVSSAGTRFSVANFAKFFWEILPHYYPQMPYILWAVGIVVLTDNTSKYKEFIVTCNTKTHYIRPLMMKISSQICHNYHSKLTMTRFYCFINGKSKNGAQKNLELDITVAKKEQFCIFPRQAGNSAADGKFRSAAWRSACRGILLAIHQQCGNRVINIYRCVKD